MTYLTESAIVAAIEELKATTHPFLGITFLACKKHELPVGKTEHIKLDTLTRTHLQRHHRLDSESIHFFQPFKSPTNWVRGNYASSGLQAMNTQTFRSVFLHERGSTSWGFSQDYVEQIRRAIQTPKYQSPPLDAIAIWLAKEGEWTRDITVDDLVQAFLRRYKITPRERKKLFAPAHFLSEIRMMTWDEPGSLGQSTPPDLRAIAHEIEPPPDVRESEGILASIELSKVGPSDRFRLDLGDRLTVIGGDNGLGKSFLLDATWWALTEEWADRPAVPFGSDAMRTARISYDLRTGAGVRTCFGTFEPQSQTWIPQRDYPQVKSLYVYASLAGAFSIKDDHRDTTGGEPLNLTAREVWDGKIGHMEGLVRDLVSWQLSETESHELFGRLLEHLSPTDLGDLQLATPMRMANDPRLIPVIKHSYGDVPAPYVSAGVRRVMTLAYVMVWAWHEHRLASEYKGVTPARRFVLLVDEIDAHLHPFWQRTILPAIMEIGEFLDERLKMQMVVSTHSPFVLASLETRFDSSSDALYHLRLDGADVHLDRERYYKRGDVSSWLTAPIFGLRHARSREAEQALDEAMQLQAARSEDRNEIHRVSKQLMGVLPADDSFWRRWTYFAKQAGVEF